MFSSPNYPSSQDINYDSDNKIFDQAFFTNINSYAKNQEIMKLTSIDIKERPSPDFILRELLNSQLPDGTLAYPIEIQEIISNCISSFVSEPFEGMTLFERRFSILDEKITDYYQTKNIPESNLKKKVSKEPESEINVEPSLSGIMFYSFANTIDFSNASVEFVISFLKSVEEIFLRNDTKLNKLNISKSAIISTKKVFNQISSIERFNIPELNILIQNLSFLLAKILNSVNPLIIHFNKILKYGKNIQFKPINFDEYLPHAESSFCRNRIIINDVKKIKHISYANLQTLIAITDENSLYFINTSNFNYEKRENVIISSELFAITLNYILEKIPNDKYSLKLRSIDPAANIEKDVTIPTNYMQKILFIWGDNDIFYFITELRDDEFGYFHLDAPDGTFSELKTVAFNFPNGYRKLTNATNLLNGHVLFNFDNSQFDLEYEFDKGNQYEHCSIFCNNKNFLSTTYRGSQYTYTRGGNEIFLNINENSLIPHFETSPLVNGSIQNEKENENNNNDDDESDQYLTKILASMRSRLNELLDRIVSDATSTSLPGFSNSPLNKFFTDDSKSAIKDILPICFYITSSSNQTDQDAEFLDILILILLACLYSNDEELENEQRLKILELYEKIFISDLPVKYPQLQIHIILSLSLSMHTLLNEDFSLIKKFFDIIIQDEQRLNNFQNSNCMLILCQTPAILYIVDDHFYEILLEHFPSKIINSLVLKIINCFYKEMLNVKSHKIPKDFLNAFVPHLIECACQSYDPGNDYFRILFRIAIQMISLKDNFLPFAFAEIVAPRLPSIYKNLIKHNRKFKESEARYSDKINHEYKKQTIQNTFESPHSSPRSIYQLTYQFPGASEIQVIFDKRCKITQQTDFTIEYVQFDGQKVTKKIVSNRGQKSGIPNFTIPSNAVTINYRTNRYQYAWGVLVTFKADILVDKFEFQPDFTQFLFSYFTHLIGKYLGCGLMSLPVTEREEECKVLLQSNILQHTTPEQLLLTAKELQSTEPKKKIDLKTQPNIKKIDRMSSEPIKRKSLSKGLSFNISADLSYPAEQLKDFLCDINSKEFTKGSFAEILFDNMYKKVPCRHRTRIVAEISAVEKASAAVMIKHLGVASEAFSYARILATESNTPVPPNLHRIWQALYKIRLQLYNLMQQTKSSSSQNNNNNDNISPFLEKTNECLLKCNFLLNNEPLLRIMINESKEDYEKKQTMEIAINELVNFIMSQVKFTEIMALVELRKERFAIRMRALNLIYQLSQELEMVTNSSLINAIIPIITLVLQNKSDINSLPLSMINEFNQSISQLFIHFIDSFLDKNKHLLVRLTYANALSAPFIKYFSDEQIEKTIQNLKSLLYENITNRSNPNDNDDETNSNKDLSSIEQVICMLIAKMSLSVSSNILPLFNSFITNESILNEEVTNLIVLIMSYLIQSHPEFQFDDINCLLKMLSNENILPRVASSIFYFIGQFLCSSNVASKIEEFKFEHKSKMMNFNGFINFILKNIGSAYLTGELEITAKTSSLKECNLFIADEMISFIRLLLSPISKVSNEVQTILHKIFSEEIEKRTSEAAGCLLVLGFGVHSLRYSSNAVFTSKKAKVNKALVQEYIPEVGQILISKNGESVGYGIDTTKPFAQPHTEIPTSFVLTDNECQSIAKILSNFDDTLFTSLITSYLPIAVQIRENSIKLLKYLSIDSLLKMALTKITDKTFLTINQLCDDILFSKNKFKIDRKLFSLSGLDTNENIASGISLYSIGAQSYEIEVIKPGNNFYFGFLSQNESISPTEQITEINFENKFDKLKSHNNNNNTNQNQNQNQNRNNNNNNNDDDNDDESENENDNDNNNEDNLNEKDNLLNAFSKRQYHIICPSKNIFAENNKFNYFPFELNKESKRTVNPGDKFICSLFNNTIYFTFCKSNKTFYLKSTNSKFAPIIRTENSVLKITPLDNPTEIPKGNNTTLIDLSVARFSKKKEKIMKQFKSTNENENNENDNDNENTLDEDNMLQSMFDEENINNNNNNEEEENNETEDRENIPFESNETTPTTTSINFTPTINNSTNISRFIPPIMGVPIESIESNDAILSSIQNLTENLIENRNSDMDSSSTISDNDNNNNNTRDSNNERIPSFLRSRRGQSRSERSIKRRKKRRNLKKKMKQSKIIKFIEPIFSDSLVQIDKIRTMIYNRKGQIEWNESKNHLFNQVGRIISIKTDNKNHSIAEVEFIDKTTGEKDIIKIDAYLLNILSIPSIDCSVSNEDFEKEKRKSFSIRMLRYTTILALENKIDFDSALSNLENEDSLFLKQISRNEEFINLLILLCLELISPNHGKDSLQSFGTKLIASSNLLLSMQKRKSMFIASENINIPNSLVELSQTSSMPLITYNEFVPPGHQKELSKHLCGLLKLISDCSPEFLPILLDKVVQQWPSLSFNEFIKYVPSELNFDIPHITKKVNLNFTFTDSSCIGYFIILSPDSNLSGQNVLKITGDENYKQEITTFHPSIYCNCFTTDKEITLSKKMIPSKKDKIHFGIVPVFKHVCGNNDAKNSNDKEDILSLLKSPASYLHIYRIITNLSLSLISTKTEEETRKKLFNIFVTKLIPLIVNKLKENDIFTLTIYYDVLSTLLHNLDFQNNPLPSLINKSFDDFIMNFDQNNNNSNKQSANSAVKVGPTSSNDNLDLTSRSSGHRIIGYIRRARRGRYNFRGRGGGGRRRDENNQQQSSISSNLPSLKIPLHVQQFIALKILLRKVSCPIQNKTQSKPSLLISKQSLHNALNISNYGKMLTSFDEIAKCQNELPSIRSNLINAELCYALTSSPIFPHYIILDDWISTDIDDTIYTGDAFNFECIVYNPNASSLSVEIEEIKTKNPSNNVNNNVTIKTVSSSSGLNNNRNAGNRKNCRSQISMDLASLEIDILDPYTKDLLKSVPLYGSATVSSNYFIIVSKRHEKNRPSSSQEMTVRVKVANLNNYGKENVILNSLTNFARDIRQYETNWSGKIDECLMQLFPPSDKIPNELPSDYATVFPILRKIDKKLLDIRLSLIRRFNNSLHSIFAMTDIKNLNLPLTQFIIKANSSILFKEKEKKIWNEVNHRNRIQLNLVFNRSKAALYLNNPKNPNGKSLLSQLMGQVQIDQLTTLRQPSYVPWHVDLQGEGASDAGGPGREIFSQMCNEIMDIRSGLFTVTPNRRRGSGPNQDVLIPNIKGILKATTTTENNNNNNNNDENNKNNTQRSLQSSHLNSSSQFHSNHSLFSSSQSINNNNNNSANLQNSASFSTLNLNKASFVSLSSDAIDDEKLNQFVYIGALMACAYISKLPQPFCFADLVWSFLVGREISIDDIFAIDEEFYHSMNSIKMCGPDVPFSSIYSTLNFTVENSFGETVELINKGTFINVDYDNRLEYCRLCEEFRKNEFNVILMKMREGIMMMLDESLSKLLCPWELRLLLCGKMEIPIDELKKVCKINGDKKYEDMLFAVLAKMSSTERMLFIKFATGRMSLPPPGLSWTSPLNVRFDNRGPGNPDNKLPYAATCSSSITIPLYSSEEIMEKMLRIAINYGGDIDQDNEPDLSEIVSLS